MALHVTAVHSKYIYTPSPPWIAGVKITDNFLSSVYMCVAVIALVDGKPYSSVLKCLVSKIIKLNLRLQVTYLPMSVCPHRLYCMYDYQCRPGTYV